MTEMLPLPTPPQPNPPRRPRINDAAVIDAAAMSGLRDVIAWFGDDYRESERDEILDHIKRAIMEGDDGFSRCVVLREHGWLSCDDELVEIMGGIDGYAELRNAVRSWVSANGIVPTLSVGDRVHVDGRLWGEGESCIGTVTRIFAETAEYIVATEKWVSEHPDQVGKGSGFVVPFERVTQAKHDEVTA